MRHLCSSWCTNVPLYRKFQKNINQTLYSEWKWEHYFYFGYLLWPLWPQARLVWRSQMSFGSQMKKTWSWRTQPLMNVGRVFWRKLYTWDSHFRLVSRITDPLHHDLSVCHYVYLSVCLPISNSWYVLTFRKSQIIFIFILR